MKSVDLRVLAAGAVIRADVCIVGSGPAGIVLAQELADGATDVVVLESGGRAETAWADALNDVEDVGAPRQPDQRSVRNRQLGGSSSTWWGRSATFSDIDLAERPWVPGSGWPIPLADIAEYFPRAAARLGLGVIDSARATALATAANPAMSAAGPLAPFAWTYSRTASNSEEVLRFGDVVATVDLPGTRLFVNATVTHIDTDPSASHVERLEVRAPDGEVRHVEASTVVLAAGGIENARLLLASRRTAAAGLGNRHDLVGRYLMDHPRGPVASYRPEAFAAVQRTLGGWRTESPIGPVRIVPGFELTPEIQERESLLHAALWVEGGFSDDDPLVAMRRLSRLSSPRADLMSVLRGAPSVVETLVRTRVQGRSAVRMRDQLLVHAIVEQQPDRASRVTLHDTRSDVYGTPIARIDWKVGDAESRTVRRAAELFAAASERLGLPAPDLDPAVFDGAGPVALPDAAHPTGTTRMARTASEGVVDTDLRVHGVNNLYVVGSSVFPTAGHANPTQMITAFAVRLGDHLRAAAPSSIEVAESPAASVAPVPSVAPVASEDAAADDAAVRPLVLLTGANGTLGRRLLPKLIAQGFAVRALTSKAPAPPTTADVEWRIHDLRQADLDFTDDVLGCSAVVHLAVEQRETEDMLRVNAEATAALARAAEAAGVQAFCYTSSISVYGSSLRSVVDETAPLLTAERDIADEYQVRPQLREYGRTKLLGERALQRAARSVEYVVFRPTVIVDEASVRDSLGMGKVSRAAAWHQRTHAVSVHDVAEAIVWALRRSLDRPAPEPGVTVYNLSDELQPQTYGDLFLAADRAAGIETPRLPAIPLAVGDALKWVQGGARRPRRQPMGSTSYPASKLYAAGYRHLHGLAAVIEAAVRIPSD